MKMWPFFPLHSIHCTLNTFGGARFIIFGESFAKNDCKWKKKEKERKKRNEQTMNEPKTWANGNAKNRS